MYVAYAVALFVPGRAVPTFACGDFPPGDLTNWSADECKLLVEEGQRQLDRQAREHERIQSRAQFLFTTALALLVVLAATARRIAERGGIAVFVLWGIGMLLVGAAVLGASALLSVRAEFRNLDARLVSQQAAGNVLREIAAAYSRSVGTGEATLQTRLTIYRDAVLLLLLAGVVEVVIWVLTAG